MRDFVTGVGGRRQTGRYHKPIEPHPRIKYVIEL